MNDPWIHRHSSYFFEVPFFMSDRFYLHINRSRFHYPTRPAWMKEAQKHRDLYHKAILSENTKARARAATRAIARARRTPNI